MFEKMWRLCCAGEINHEADEEPLKYGSNGTVKQGIDGPPTSNGIDNDVTTVSYKKRTESESSTEQNKTEGKSVCDSITSSEPCTEPAPPDPTPPVPQVTVNPPKDPPPPRESRPTKKSSDSRSVSSSRTASPNTKIRLLDLAEGRYSDSDLDGNHDDDDHGESCDSLDDLDSSRNRKKGPLSSMIGASRESILSVYSDAGEVNYGKIPVTGEVLFGLDYNNESQTLRIDVQECKDIAAVDTKNKRSDPYVKTYLLPDKSRNGKWKTKIKKHTLNPVFNEVLKYNIAENELSNRVLWLTVWNNDKFGGNDFLGEVLVEFENFTFRDNSPRWYPLQERLLEGISPDPIEEDKGDIVISMCYITPDSLDQATSKKKKKKTSKGELHVIIKQAHNLTALHSNGTSNPFCKGYLLPDKSKHSKQKTNVIKKDCSPTWNHLFIFENVGLEELPQRCLELTVWDHESLSSNDFLGGNRFNLGTGTCDGKEVDWMDGRGEEIAKWEEVINNPNTWIEVKIQLRPSMGENKVKK